MDKISDRIKQIRSTLDLTQKDLARKTGITKDSIINYENERRVPSIKFVSALVTNLKINANWFFTGEGELLLQTDIDTDIEKKGIIESVKKETDSMTMDFLSNFFLHEPIRHEILSKYILFINSDGVIKYLEKSKENLKENKRAQ